MRSKMARWLVAATLLAVTTVPVLAAGRGWLGVSTQSTDDDLRRGLDLTRDGLLVNQVESDSPADRAGLRKGDVILTYNSRTVTEPEALRDLVRDTAPGRSASLSIWRDGARRTLQITVGELPDNLGDSDNSGDARSDSSDDRLDTPVPPSPPEAPEAPSPPRTPRAPHAPRALGDRDDGDVHRRVIINGREVPEDEIDGTLKDMHVRELDGFDHLKNLKGLKGLKRIEGIEGLRGFGSGEHFDFTLTPGRGRLGVRIDKLNDDMAQALGASGDKGVLVIEVLADTPAQKAGMRAGDVIVRVGDDDVNAPDGLVKALSGRDGRVDIVVLRRGARRTLQVELESRSQPSEELRTQLRGAPGWRETPRNMEPGQGSRVYRWNTRNDADQDAADLRQELQDLKRELQALREELRAKK